jgi:hypothetical protein
VRDRNLLVSALLAISLAAMPLAGPAAADGSSQRQDLVVTQLVAPPTASELTHGDELDPADQRYPWLFPRTSVDRPDERSGRQLHIVYLVAAGMPDDHYDELGFLEDSVRSMNVWMKQQTGNQQWKFDMHTFTAPDAEGVMQSVNAVDVTFIQSNRPSGSLDTLGEVRSELAPRGLNDPNKRYLAYVATNAGNVCGEAYYTYDPTPTAFDGQYSSVYLYSSSGCRAREFAPNATQPSYTESIAMQEMVHNDGMVPMVAPRNCLVSLLAFGHVCTGPLWAGEVAGQDVDPERFDVMYPYVGLPLNQKSLDADHLDYYRHPAPYRDLEQSPYLETV